MKRYFYKRNDGTIVHIEAEQLFWSGTACVFVKGGTAAAVIALLPGELVFEVGAITEVQTEERDEADKKQSKPN